MHKTSIAVNTRSQHPCRFYYIDQAKLGEWMSKLNWHEYLVLLPTLWNLDDLICICCNTCRLYALWNLNRVMSYFTEVLVVKQNVMSDYCWSWLNIESVIILCVIFLTNVWLDYYQIEYRGHYNARQPDCLFTSSFVQDASINEISKMQLFKEISSNWHIPPPNPCKHHLDPLYGKHICLNMTYKQFTKDYSLSILIPYIQQRVQ